MNFQLELELLIRERYPVLTIISNKETVNSEALVEFANKRRKTSSSKAAAKPASTYILPQANAVHGAARRKNWPALVGKIVK